MSKLICLRSGLFVRYVIAAGVLALRGTFCSFESEFKHLLHKMQESTFLSYQVLK